MNVASEKKGYKRSKQRERILELLRATEIHPTATWIYSQLRKEFPDLSLGTVYRNLNILFEQGLINKIHFGSTFDRFDANTGPHDHFICERCGAMIDIQVPLAADLDAQASKWMKLPVHRHKIELFGFCAACVEEA